MIPSWVLLSYQQLFCQCHVFLIVDISFIALCDERSVCHFWKCKERSETLVTTGAILNTVSYSVTVRKTICLVCSPVWSQEQKICFLCCLCLSQTETNRKCDFNDLTVSEPECHSCLHWWQMSLKCVLKCASDVLAFIVYTDIESQQLSLYKKQKQNKRSPSEVFSELISYFQKTSKSANGVWEFILFQSNWFCFKKLV